MRIVRRVVVGGGFVVLLSALLSCGPAAPGDAGRPRAISPGVRAALSRDPRLLRTEVREGRRITAVTGGFAEMLVARTAPDGRVSVHCVQTEAGASAGMDAPATETER